MEEVATSEHELIESSFRVFTATKGSAEPLLPASELHPLERSADEATGITGAMLL